MENSSTSILPFPVEPGHRCRPVAGWLLSAAGHTAMYVLVGGWFLGWGIALELWGNLPGLALFVITVPLIFLVFPSMAALVARGRRMRALPAFELLQRERQAPVVLLRSFNDDDLIDPSYPATNRVVPDRYENRLIEALAPLGPAVALGRPGEREPELGAARLYVKDENWQHAITWLMERAAVVVAIVGGSPGLWWEIELAIEQTPLHRMLFFFPYPAPPETRRSYWRTAFLQHQVWGRFIRRKLFPVMDAERQARYQAFRERVNPRLPHPLPNTLGGARFIAFSTEGRPQLIKAVAPSILTRVITMNFDPKMDIPFKLELQSFVSNRLMEQARPR